MTDLATILAALRRPKILIRAAGEATYSIQRHVAVLTAILAEARLSGTRAAA